MCRILCHTRSPLVNSWAHRLTCRGAAPGGAGRTRTNRAELQFGILTVPEDKVVVEIGGPSDRNGSGRHHGHCEPGRGGSGARGWALLWALATSTLLYRMTFGRCPPTTRTQSRLIDRALRIDPDHLLRLTRACDRDDDDVRIGGLPLLYADIYARVAGNRGTLVPYERAPSLRPLASIRDWYVE
jgi:hypothetical protein